MTIYSCMHVSIIYHAMFAGLFIVKVDVNF